MFSYARPTMFNILLVLVTSVDNFSVCMYVCMYVCYGNGTVGLIAGFYTCGPYQFSVFFVYFAQA